MGGRYYATGVQLGFVIAKLQAVKGYLEKAIPQTTPEGATNIGQAASYINEILDYIDEIMDKQYVGQDPTGDSKVVVLIDKHTVNKVVGQT
jgi:hypothetical protein